jgi:PPM family protein phosphatase
LNVDDLLSIGDFAAQSGLSPKMLRSYAAVGLLVPAAIDGSSGYRFYSTGQLHQARIVALLRHAGIAVDDIATFMVSPASVQLDRWEQLIAQESLARRQAFAEARAALALDPTPRAAQSEASTKGWDVPHDFSTGTATHIGGRDSNQDAVLISDKLFAIADGLGGLQNGDIASRLALDSLHSAFAGNYSISGLIGACRESNRAVWLKADGQEASIGTTLTALAITTDVAEVVVNVGDSRLYRMRHGRLVRLTEDHTVTAESIRVGELSEDDAHSHPFRNVLTRAIGVGPDVEVDYAGVSCESGDRFLLCTDGLFRALSPEEIKAGLDPETSPQQSADNLVGDAVEHGAEDNVTVMVIDSH